MRAPAEENLSVRELEVLSLVARELGVDDRTAAVTAALERGILRLKS